MSCLRNPGVIIRPWVQVRCACRSPTHILDQKSSLGTPAEERREHSTRDRVWVCPPKRAARTRPWSPDLVRPPKRRTKIRPEGLCWAHPPSVDRGLDQGAEVGCTYRSATRGCQLRLTSCTAPAATGYENQLWLEVVACLETGHPDIQGFSQVLRL